MKHKHLTISLLFILPALIALCGLGSCTDDYLYKSVQGGLKPGLPVEISLGLQVPEAEEAVVGGSRATTETETDRTVYDLYLFIFDQNTNQLKSKYYFPQINSTTGGIPCDPAYSSTGSAAILRKRGGESKTSGVIEKIHTTTGPSRIVGVANCNRKGSALILDKLSKVETVQDLRDVMVSTIDPDSKLPDFEQSLAVMSGYYCDDNDNHQANHLYTPCDFVNDEDESHTHKGYVNIDREQLGGTLWLTPLQSRVKFLVLSEGHAETDGIPAGKFQLTSWQVYNLPGRTPLFCRGYADGNEPLEPKPINSLALTRFDDSEEVVKDELPADETYDGIFGFNFFVADNHPGKGNAENIKNYADRARWNKTTGEDRPYTSITPPEEKAYTNAPAGATYVVIRGTYTGASKVTEADGTQSVKNVTGDVTYTVFLGHNSGSGAGCDNTDFNTYRNYKYTYIVRVKGIDKITVEVNTEEEERPDAEGDIITTTYDTETLDAHYEQRVVSIKKQNIIDAINAKNLQVSVTVPLFRVNRLAYKYQPDAEDPWADTNNALPYMEWLEFYEHKTEEAGRRYIHYSDVHGDAARSIPRQIMNVKEFMQRLHEYANDETAPEEHTFTVFFSEYLYKKHPVTGAAVEWQDLLRNGESRRFTMLGTTKFAPDHNSSYSNAGTTYVQRCMQTIYDVDMAGLKQGWATECIEEDIFEKGNSGVPVDMFDALPRYQWNGGALEVTKFGRQNCWRVNSGTKGAGKDTWEYTLLINDDGYLKPPSNKGHDCKKNETNLLTACLQRNRDLNGNGYIDRSEFVWYVPSLEQMQLLYIGYGALTDDVQLYNAQREARAGRVTTTTYENRHYLTSSLNKIWTEEGVSYSDLALGSTTGGWNSDKNYFVRCARSLGTSTESDDTDGIPWDIDKHPEYQFESIYEYQPYAASEIEETENGEIAKYKDHKRGRITVRYLNPQSLINVPRFTETPGRVLSFSENNFPTFQFEIADTVIAIDGAETFATNRPTIEKLFTDLKDEPDFSPCNVIGPGWRIPTITELTIMQWAWHDNWMKSIAKDFVNDPGFKKMFPGTTLNMKNISGYLWHAFVGSNGSVDLLARTQYHYRYVGANGLHPTFNNNVRTYHVFEKTGSNGKFSIEVQDFNTHTNNVAIRCVRSYSTTQANAPAQAPKSRSAATTQRKLRKK